jgi:hypothetical protein
VAGGEATADRHIYQLRILDYGAGKGLNHPLITIEHGKQSGEHKFANIGWAGFVGCVSGINERGLCVSEMGFGNPSRERLDATPMVFLLKQVFRYADNAREARSIFHAAQRNNSYAYFVGDPSGSMVALLTHPASFREYWVNEHETLFIPEVGATLPQFKDTVYGGHFCVKQSAVVRRMHGKLNLEHIQQMAREIAMRSNLQTVIFDLTSGNLWVANAAGGEKAADCVYVPLSREDW